MNLKMKLPRYTYDYDGLFFFLSSFFLSASKALDLSEITARTIK